MSVIVEFIQLLMTGVQSVFSFITTLPTLFQSITAFPPILYTTLLAGFGVIVAIRCLELLP